MLLSDPLRDRILPLMAQYPLQAGPLYTAYKDLALAVEWQDLRIVPLQGTEWVCIVGHKRKEDALRIVLPLPLHTTALRPSSLKAIFNAARSLTLDTLPPADEQLVPSIAELKARAARSAKAGKGGASVKDESGKQTGENGQEHPRAEFKEDDIGGADEKADAAERDASRSGQQGHEDGGVPPTEAAEEKGGTDVRADTDTDTEIDRDTLYMAICTTDATVVYYKLARGIRKPADIPDE